ncbi:MAG: endonuclease III [Chloroflexi bacterium]|nr:endonuclease III [Chloroflexota bacterium]
MITKAVTVYNTLKQMYPDARPSLHFSNSWQVLVATILSAQCTDAKVNQVTPTLFKYYPLPGDLAEADIDDVIAIIYSTGFYNNKAKNIIATAQIITHDFGGQVPDNMADLLKLRGVARKTANIVLTDGFHIVDGIAVDTHVGRISRRLGFTVNTDSDKVEKDICTAFPKEDWGNINHLMIYFGRDICASQRPQCIRCPFFHKECLSNGTF